MLLKCDCVNSSADARYGQGIRRHSALVPFDGRPGKQPKNVPKPQQEFICNYCAYVRTMARGKLTGAKSGA